MSERLYRLGELIKNKLLYRGVNYDYNLHYISYGDMLLKDVGRRKFGRDPTEDEIYELAEEWRKSVRTRSIETPVEVTIEDDDWDDFEQVYTEIYLSLRGLPQSRSIV